MTDVELLGVFVTTAVGSGVGAYLSSYLKKKGENLATHEDIDKLVKQVSAVTAATKQIEARIARASRVHERELDILGKLYRHLHDAQGLFQSMTRGGRFAGEISPEQYAPKVNEAMRAAYEEFLNGRLFIPLALVQLCEDFFKAALQGQLDFAWSLQASVNPVKRSEFWDATGAVAYEKLPKILQQIDDAARSEIGAGNWK